MSSVRLSLRLCRKLLEGEECRLSSVGGAMLQSGYPGFSYMSSRTYSLGAYRKSEAKPEEEEEEGEEEEEEEEGEENEEEGDEGEEGEEGDDQEEGEGEGEGEGEEEEEEEEKPKEKEEKEKKKESPTGKTNKS